MIEVSVTDEFEEWYDSLSASEQTSIDVVVEMLIEAGVALPYPYSSNIEGSKYGFRELRPKRGKSPLRPFYAFDPSREAILIFGGAKGHHRTRPCGENLGSVPARVQRARGKSMKTKKWADFIKERRSDEEIEQAKLEAAEELKFLDLQRLRKLRGQTQAEVAERLHISQSELSRVERRQNLTLATLQKVIEALGGKLRISAQFENVDYTLKDVWARSEIPDAEIIDAHQKTKVAGRRSRAGR